MLVCFVSQPYVDIKKKKKPMGGIVKFPVSYADGGPQLLLKMFECNVQHSESTAIWQVANSKI